MKAIYFSHFVNATIYSKDLTVYMWIDKLIIRSLITEEQLTDFTFSK